MVRNSSNPAAGGVEKWHVGEWRLVRAAYAPETQLRPHCDGHFRLSVVVSGQLREHSGSTEEFGSALSVVIKPADARHSNRFGPRGARIVSVQVPANRLDGPERNGSRLSDWRWVHAGVLAQALDFIGLMSHRSKPGRDTVTEHVDLLLDALADVPLPPDRHAPAWLRTVRDHLHDTFDQPTPVHVLASDAGVHPTHLTRWFRHFYGCPVTTYRQRLRVKAVMQALTSTDASLAGIATDAGFFDQSHLHRIFRKHTRKTPACVRRLICPM